MISSYLPYPLFDGGSVRLYNLMRELQEDHDITLICEQRAHQGRVEKEAVEKICKKVITVPRRKQWSLPNLLKTGFSQDSFLIVGHTLPLMKKAIQEELKTEKYDLIHVETSYVMQNLPTTKLPVVLVEHNIEYMVYEKFMNKAPLSLRPFLNIDIQKLKKCEEAFWHQATQVVTVSDVEKEVVEKTGVKAKTVYNGVDLETFKLKRSEAEKGPREFLFIGSYKWLQNRDSVRWILQDIWPKIRQNSGEKVMLRIVGRDMPRDIKNWKDDSVIIEENSSRKAVDIFSESFALLAPIRIGGGSQYKILESMAVGTPVLTTSLGLSGLDISPDQDILVADTAQGLAESALQLLKDPKLSQSLRTHARKQIEAKYDWSAIAKTLESIYQSVV